MEPGALPRGCSYDPNMARKVIPPKAIGPDWFLQDWMKARDCTQADLCRELNWSKAKVNDIYHGRTEYYRGIVNPIAWALKVEPWELLLHPADANALKAMQESALRLVAERREAFKAEQPPAAGPGDSQPDRLAPPRRSAPRRRRA